MAYCAASDVKTYLGITGSGDDTLIAALCVRAQALVDRYCNRTFEAASNTNRTFDAVRDVSGRVLYLDEDLASINTITNGDATSVTSGQYVTEPRQTTPYHALRLLASANIAWTYTTDPENAITISGKWAYSTAAPADIVHAAIRWAAYLYRQKDASTYDVTAAPDLGVITVPQGIPADIEKMLAPYRKVV
jgi:hypothetical protein